MVTGRRWMFQTYAIFPITTKLWDQTSISMYDNSESTDLIKRDYVNLIPIFVLPKKYHQMHIDFVVWCYSTAKFALF